MRGDPRDELRLDELEGDLQAGLGALISGLEFVDRDLELEPNLRVDYVGLDTRGRLLMVLLVNEDDDATPLLALDVLAYARQNLTLLARHLTKGRLRSDLTPLVALVAERFSSRLIARLEPLRETIRLFEVRELRSSGGSASYLVPVGGGGELEAPASTSGSIDFVVGLPEEERELGYLLVRRISRIDDDMECRPLQNGLSWSYNGAEICSIRKGPEGLFGVITQDGPRMSIRTSREVEAFVEEALAYQVERAEDPLEEAPLSQRRPPPLEGPLLTDEEIQAFQQ